MRAVPKPAAKADALPELFKSVRARTRELCEPLEIEDYIPQPVIDVSPPKWNIAHTTWFFEEMILKKFTAGYEVFDPDFGFLFNSYYNTIGERTARDHRGDLSRPTVKKVFEYREYVDEKMLELLAAKDSDELRELVILGCNHEQQHQELFLTDLKYTFSVNPLFPAYREGFNPEEIYDAPEGGGSRTSKAAFTRSATQAKASASITNSLGMKCSCVISRSRTAWSPTVISSSLLRMADTGGMNSGMPRAGTG